MEYPLWSIGSTSSKGPFSIAVLVYQSVFFVSGKTSVKGYVGIDPAQPLYFFLGGNQEPCLEDHPSLSVVSNPQCLSHGKAIWKGVPQPYLGDLRITMVVNHLLG